MSPKCTCCIYSLLPVGYLLLMVLSYMVSARDYRLEVILVSYENPLNQDSSGQCCEPSNLRACQQSVTCHSKCDPFFTIDVTSSDVKYTTPVYPNTDSLTFPDIVYVFYGNDSIWPDHLFVNVTASDYSEFKLPGEIYYETLNHIQYHEFKVNTLSPSSLEENNCSFQDESNFTSSCDGYIWLKLSYRLLETTSACLSIGDQVQNSESDGHRCGCLEEHPGMHCELTDLCIVYSPCQNGGNCSHTMVNTSLGSPQRWWYTCQCPENWTGHNCDVFVPQPTSTITNTVTVTLSSSPDQSLMTLASSQQTLPYINSSTIVTPCSPPFPPECRLDDNRMSSLPTYIGVAIGGFMAGFALTVFIGIYSVIQLKRKVSKPQLKYLSRRQRNPFYQSVEDLVDGDTNNSSKTQNISPPDDNGGYDTLRPLPPSLGRGRLLPLSRKEKGYLYCLSPTDPPVPLRALSSGLNRQYETIKLQGLPHVRPQNLLQGCCAKQAGDLTGDSQQGSLQIHPTRTHSLDDNLSMQCKSPIYEMPRPLQHASQSNVPVVSADISQPPTLPRRVRPHTTSRKTPESIWPPPSPLQLSTESTAGALESALCLSSGNAQANTNQQQGTPTEGELGGGKEEQGEASKTTRSSLNDDGQTTTDLSSLYSKVKKQPKVNLESKLRRDMDNHRNQPGGDKGLFSHSPGSPAVCPTPQRRPHSMFVGDDKGLILWRRDVHNV